MSIRRFVDAHVHLWKLDHLRYPWLTGPFDANGPNGSVEPIAHDYLPDDYRKDAAGYNVVKAVHIDAGAHPDDAIGETRWLQNLADHDGFPSAIVAYAALNDLNLDAHLAEYVQSPNVRGIRHILNWHPDPARTYTPKNLFDDPQLATGYALLAKHNLSFDLQIYPNQMQAAYQLAKNQDDIPLILNHMGMPVDADRTQWRAGMQALAQLPQAAVKISGFGFFDRQWTTESVRPLVLDVIAWFGADRVLFASDFPTDKLFNSYGRALDAYDAITQDFTTSERDNMFGQNAERIYRI